MEQRFSDTFLRRMSFHAKRLATFSQVVTTSANLIWTFFACCFFYVKSTFVRLILNGAVGLNLIGGWKGEWMKSIFRLASHITSVCFPAGLGLNDFQHHSQWCKYLWTIISRHSDLICPNSSDF